MSLDGHKHVSSVQTHAIDGASMLLKREAPDAFMNSILDMIYTNIVDFAGQQRMASNEGLLFSIVRANPAPDGLLLVNSCFYIDGPQDSVMMRRLDSVHYKIQISGDRSEQVALMAMLNAFNHFVMQDTVGPVSAADLH